MTDCSLAELLQQAEQLTSHIDGTGDDLPRVDRSLNQILHSGDRLWPRTPAAGQDAQASILLGSRGLDLPHISHKLDVLSTVRSLEALEPVHDTDIVTFLKNERENAIITAIEDAKKQTKDEVERLYWEQRKSQWEQTKQKLLSAFTHTRGELLNFALQPQETLPDLSSTVLKSRLTKEEMAYLHVIRDYNQEILQGGIRPNLAQELSSCFASSEDKTIKELWSLVCCLTEVPLSIGGDIAKARGSAKVQAALARQAKQHLEKNYEEYMKRLVYTKPEMAHLGGIPGLVNLVKAFLKVVLPRHSQPQLEDGEAHGAPVWPFIFFCLRAGGVKAAVEAAAGNNSPSVTEVVMALKQLDKSDSGRLSLDTEKKLRLSYERHSKSFTDPFKRGVYCVLGRCDPADDHPDIATTTDDYMWIKLSMVECDSSAGQGTGSSSAPSLSLIHLQNMLYEKYGESHFNAWQQPILYTSVLFLCGMIEEGLEFLSRVERLLTHAVHIALAFHEMNMLILPSLPHAPMLSREDGDLRGIRRLNMTRLILLYTRKFEISDPGEALHYCYFLRHLKDKDGKSVFTGCVSELVLQSQEFDLLLGRLNADGCRLSGFVDKFKVDTAEITEIVAQDSEKKGLYEDAIKLYDLAKNHEKVVALLNQLLPQVLHQAGQAGAGSRRQRLIDLASTVALRMKTHGHSASEQTIATLHLLLDLSAFFDYYFEEHLDNAIDVLARLKVVALNRSEVETRVANLTSYGLEVRTVLPHVLLAAMNVTYKLYKAALSSTPQSPGPSALNTSIQASPTVKHLQEQARAIVTFAGMTPLRLHGDIDARLVQLEALIN